MNTPAWIGLGSNLGDRRAILDAAVAALADAPGVAVEAVSSYRETNPVGGPPGQGAFLNAAVRLATTLGPHELLAVTRGIEDRFGRVRTVRWGERTLDIDLLIYGVMVLDTPDLKLPHPRLAFRRFVLAPLAEIAPSLVEAVSKRTVGDLLANLDRRPRLLALEGPPGTLKAAVFRRLVEELPAAGVEGGPEVTASGKTESRLEKSRRQTQAFGKRARALDAARWTDDCPGGPWIVADYFLDPGLIRDTANSPPEMFVEGPTEEWAGQAADDEEWRRLNRWAADHVLVPTFAVVLPGNIEVRRRPGILSVPSLWPESQDPDAILAEIMAACRGMEGD